MAEKHPSSVVRTYRFVKIKSFQLRHLTDTKNWLWARINELHLCMVWSAALETSCALCVIALEAFGPDFAPKTQSLAGVDDCGLCVCTVEVLA